MVTDFMRPTRVEKLAVNSDRAKKLTTAVAEFIARDLRPITIVDGTGFLNLMQIAEPRYVVPCRATITARIQSMYAGCKEKLVTILAVQSHISLTTDMWTSRAGDGYISLTCHCVSSEFEMHHRNLFTRHLPGVHDHVNIAEALRASTMEWGIDLQDQVMGFTTDNGSNIVKTIKDDLQKLRIPCVGHILNLAVQAALKVPRLSRILGRCRKGCTTFQYVTC